MAALGVAGNGGSPEGPERGEGAAKRLDTPFPAVHAASHMYWTRTVFSDTISPFALRRPFFVTGSSPSFATLRRYAEATGTRLTVGLARADG